MEMFERQKIMAQLAKERDKANFWRDEAEKKYSNYEAKKSFIKNKANGTTQACDEIEDMLQIIGDDAIEKQRIICMIEERIKGIESENQKSNVQSPDEMLQEYLYTLKKVKIFLSHM